MAGLTMHNFVSAATGIALAIALIRGFARRSAQTIGNFWVDMTRTVLYVLLPISIVVGLFFVWQGMPQNLNAYTEVTTLEGGKQMIAQGQVASQEVIKMMGTNGGGFFNANSAHPYENPNALTNFVQMVLIFSIGAALTNVFGRMVGKERQGWAIFAAMGILFLAGTFTVYATESGGNPAFVSLPIDATSSSLQAGGNMEGKEVRFGIANSSLFTTITTDASCGAVNNMHDSLLPLAGMVPMVNIMLGEIIFGGVGSGLYGMLLFAIVAVFVAVTRAADLAAGFSGRSSVGVAAIGVVAARAGAGPFASVAVICDGAAAGTEATEITVPSGRTETVLTRLAVGNDGGAEAGAPPRLSEGATTGVSAVGATGVASATLAVAAADGCGEGAGAGAAAAV